MMGTSINNLLYYEYETHQNQILNYVWIQYPEMRVHLVMKDGVLFNPKVARKSPSHIDLKHIIIFDFGGLKNSFPS